MTKRIATLVTDQDHEDHYRDAVRLLRSVRVGLAEMLVGMRDGDASPKDVAAKQAELETALRRAFESEERWNAWVGKAANDDRELDMEAVRADLACRLARVQGCDPRAGVPSCCEGA